MVLLTVNFTIFLLIHILGIIDDTPKFKKKINDSIPSIDSSFKEDSMNDSRLTDNLFNNSLNSITSSTKQRLFKGTFKELILWPDSSLFRHKDLPSCVLTPRYIYAPPEATSN